MMIAEFKGSFTIDWETFPIGEHVLNKDQSNHWYTKALIDDGLIVVLKDDIEAEVVEDTTDENTEETTETKAEVVEEKPRSNRKRQG